MMERLSGRVRVSAASIPILPRWIISSPHRAGRERPGSNLDPHRRNEYGLIDSPEAGVFGPGEVLDFGKNRFEAMALPGHSPGHLGFREPRERILFAVDVGLDRFGPWYGFTHCRLDEYLAAIRNCAATRPGCSWEANLIPSPKPYS